MLRRFRDGMMVVFGDSHMHLLLQEKGEQKLAIVCATDVEKVAAKDDFSFFAGKCEKSFFIEFPVSHRIIDYYFYH